MKPEEAIEDIRKCIQPSVDGKSLQMAIEALEKQIPKKPIMGEFGVYVCSDCECVVEEENDYGRWEDRFCPECGQRIDWEETP